MDDSICSECGADMVDEDVCSACGRDYRETERDIEWVDSCAELAAMKKERDELQRLADNYKNQAIVVIQQRDSLMHQRDKKGQQLGAAYCRQKELEDDLATLRAERDALRSLLGWFVEFCDEHPEWTESELCNGRDDSAEAEWLNAARAALASGGKAGA